MKQTKSTAISFVLKRRLRLTFAISMLGTIFILFLLNGYSSNSRSVNVRRFYSSFLQDQETDRNVSICCLIITSPRNFLTRAKAINDTWGPRCDRYYFISELANVNLTAEQTNITRALPMAPIANLTRGYDHLTLKSNQAFLFAYEHHLNDSEWFVKADDDTYLIVDHLKAFLREQNSSDPVTFGYNYKVMPTFDLFFSPHPVEGQKRSNTFVIHVSLFASTFRSLFPEDIIRVVPRTFSVERHSDDSIKHMPILHLRVEKMVVLKTQRSPSVFARKASISANPSTSKTASSSIH